MKREKSDKSGRSERLTITLGSDQRRKLAVIARKRRTSAATVIRWALDEYIASKTDDGNRDRSKRS